MAATLPPMSASLTPNSLRAANARVVYEMAMWPLRVTRAMFVASTVTFQIKGFDESGVLRAHWGGPGTTCDENITPPDGSTTHAAQS